MWKCPPKLEVFVSICDIDVGFPIDWHNDCNMLQKNDHNMFPVGPEQLRTKPMKTTKNKR